MSTHPTIPGLALLDGWIDEAQEEGAHLARLVVADVARASAGRS